MLEMLQRNAVTRKNSDPEGNVSEPTISGQIWRRWARRFSGGDYG